MSDTNPHTYPPVELQGFFPDYESLMIAFDRLSDAGFSRSDLSPPSEHPHFGEQRSSDPSNSNTIETDRAQLRTLGTGMAGYVGAAAMAGATIATGGAASLVVAATAAAGVGSAAIATSVGQVTNKIAADHLGDMAAEGRLVLGVRTATKAAAERATEILKAAGATKIEPITVPKDATTAGLSSASWTG